MNSNTFPGFEHSADELSEYIFSLDLFVISLVSQKVVRYTAPDAAAFNEWLRSNGVQDINDEAGSMIMDYYFKGSR